MKWFIIFFVAALIGYFLWIKGHLDSALPEKLVPMMAKEKSAGAGSETPDAAMPSPVETPFAMKNVNPDLKSTGKVYTAEDIKKINENIEKDSPKENTFTNADIKKYRERPGTPNAEKVKKEIEWAEEPAKKPKKK
jgi:hypothetical protein